MKKDIMEAWEIFMKLCEEFPELYDKYVKTEESKLKDDKRTLTITAEDKEHAWKKLQEKIRKEP